MMPVVMRAPVSSGRLTGKVSLQKSFATGQAIRSSVALPRRAAPRPLASRGAVKVMAASYICIDCGYIYDGSEGPFEKLPNNYKCPACNAPKRRFQTWNGSGKNDPKSMKNRMTQLKSGGGTPAKASGGDSNPAVLVGAGIAILAALYFGLGGYYN